LGYDPSQSSPSGAGAQRPTDTLRRAAPGVVRYLEYRATSASRSNSGADKKMIEDLGGPPIMVRDTSGTVSLKRLDASRLKVRALDFNGYVRAALPGGADAIGMVPDAIYGAIGD
jgi:hypothetical protein